MENQLDFIALRHLFREYLGTVEHILKKSKEIDALVMRAANAESFLDLLKQQDAIDWFLEKGS